MGLIQLGTDVQMLIIDVDLTWSQLCGSDLARLTVWF